jgi:hypothetical protein
MATEDSVQGAVFNLELGRGKQVLQWVVVVLGAIVLSLLYTLWQFRGLEKREAIDMAQLARNVSRGEGLTTSMIRPVSLWHLKTYRADHDPKFVNHPDLYNPPLYPLILGGIFRLMPAKIFEAKPNETVYAPERWVIVPLNQLFLLLTLLLVYHWSKRLFDKRVAVMAGLILLFSDTLWAYATAGLPTMLLQLLLLSSLYCLFLLNQRLNPAGAKPTPAGMGGASIGLIVASAVLMGACFLTRYTAGFLVIPVVLYLWWIVRNRSAGLWAAVYVVIFLAVIAPWLVRNYEWSNSVLGIARYQFFETDAFDRTYSVDLKGAWSMRGVVGHFLTNLRTYWLENFRSIGTDICVFFFVAGVLYNFRRPEVSRLRRVLLGCLALALLGMAMVGMPSELVNPSVNGGNLLVVFLPLVVVYGCAFFYLLLDRINFSMKLTRALAIGAFFALNIAPMIFVVLPPRRGPFPYPPYLPPVMQGVTKYFEKNEVGVSDMPWATAWYMDRTTVWLPFTPDEYYEIHDFVAPHNTQFMMLTPYMLDRHYETDLVKGEYKPWSMILRGQLPDKFPLRAVVLPGPQTDQILLADRARWKTSEDTNAVGAATEP